MATAHPHQEKLNTVHYEDGVTEDHGLHAEHIARPGYFRSSLFLGSMTAVGMGLLSAIAGFGYVAPILTLINDDIGPSTNIVWVSLVYTLMIAIGLTVVGRFTDIFGRRYTFIGGGVLGVVGSIVCATAHSVNALIAGMTFIGLAASTQVSYFYVMAELVPMEYRFAGNAVMYIFAIPGGAFSPAIANSLIAHTKAGWRGCFWIVLGFNAVALACWVLFYRPPTFQMKHQGQRRRDYAKQFDYIGLVLFAAGLLVFLLGLSWGGSAYPWQSAYVIGPMVAGFVALVVFVLWECFAPIQEPLVPMRLVLNRAWIAAVVVSGIGASLYYCLAVLWPAMVSIIYPSGNTTKDGVNASVIGAGWVLGEIVSGFVAMPLKRLRYQCIVVLTLAGIFLGCKLPSSQDTKPR